MNVCSRSSCWRWSAGRLPPAACGAGRPDRHSVTITVDDVRPSTPDARPARTHAGDRPHAAATTTAQDLNERLACRPTAATRSAPRRRWTPRSRSRSHRARTSCRRCTAIPSAVGTLLAGSPGRRRLRDDHVDGHAWTPGICLCHDAIYPLYFTATYTDPDTGAGHHGRDGADLPARVRADAEPVAAAGHLALAAARPPAPADRARLVPRRRPDRARSTDGGRLDRALQRRRGRRAVRAAHPRGRSGSAGRARGDGHEQLPGRGADDARPAPSPAPARTVARAWLDRFTAVINAHPDIDVDLTAYADPDVESLTRNGLSWTPSVGRPGDTGPPRRRARHAGAVHDVAWPVGSTLSQPTLTAARPARHVDRRRERHDAAAGTGRDSASNALAPGADLGRPGDRGGHVDRTGTGRRVRCSSPAGPGLGGAARTRRAPGDPGARQPATRATTSCSPPPRELDVDPRIAERALLATAHAFWNRRGRAEHGDAHGAGHRPRRAAPGPSAPRLPAQAISAMQTVDRTLPGLTGKYGLFDRTAPNARHVQRRRDRSTASRSACSAARRAGCSTDPRLQHRAGHRAGRVASTDSAPAVHLVPPAGNASYTLTSNEAPLPVTITNPLDVTAQVRVQVQAEDNRPGFEPRRSTSRCRPAATQQVPRADQHRHHRPDQRRGHASRP